MSNQFGKKKIKHFTHTKKTMALASDKKKVSSELLTKEILNTREAAALLKVTPQTIKNYIYSGKLKALKTPGGHHRIRRVDLEKIGFSPTEAFPEHNPSHHELIGSYQKLVDVLITTIEAFIKALDARDIIASGHSQRVASLATMVGKTLGYSDRDLYDLRMAALLHDVGKVGISEAILGKPGKLTDQELFLIQRHPEIGEKIVSSIDQLQRIAPVVRHHHERFDGQGYPDRLSGAAIEKDARIIAVAGAFDFLRSDLSFRPALSTTEALHELHHNAGSQFDPEIVEAFTQSVRKAEDQLS